MAQALEQAHALSAHLVSAPLSDNRRFNNPGAAIR